MYHFSRSIYKALAPMVVEDESEPGGCRNKQRVLDACEGAMCRLATDRRYFARPARFLFNEVRRFFAFGDQLRVRRVIEVHMNLAEEFVSNAPEEVLLDGHRRECRAHTRQGTPCQRDPLPGREYCPSHKHLEEGAEDVDAGLGRIAARSGRHGEAIGAAA